MRALIVSISFRSDWFKGASQHPAQLPRILCTGAAAGTTVHTEVGHIVAFLRRPGWVVAIRWKRHRLSAGSTAAEVRPVRALARGVPVCTEAAVEVPERIVVVEVWVDIVGRRGGERRG